MREWAEDNDRFVADAIGLMTWENAIPKLPPATLTTC